VRVLDALLPEVHAGGGPAASTRASGCTPDVATQQALDGVDAVCHQAAMVGLGVDLQDLPLYVGHNDLGTAVLLAAMERAGCRAPGAGQLDGRLRRGPLHLRRARPRPARPARRRPPCAQGVSSRPARPAAGRWTLAPCRRTHRWTRATSTPPSKTAQEHLASSWARASGGTAVALRYHNVYGPHMPKDTPYAGVASLFRSALERGEAPRVFEDGGQRRDFVHVRDVAQANLLARTAPAAGPTDP
jgi:dTDP-L-rhamnose 4-epimerase